MPRTGFKETRQKVIQSLENGSFQHETRTAIDTKNWLAMGNITASDVVDMLKICRGNQHTTSRHHADRSIELHIIKTERPRRWYIKFYFLEPEVPETMFISVHPADEG